MRREKDTHREKNMGSYTVLPVTEQDKPATLEFLKQTFFPLEPLNQGVGLCAGGARCEELESYCEVALSAPVPLSLRAVDAAGDIVGVTVTSQQQNTEQSYLELVSAAERCEHPLFSRVLRVLCERERAAALWTRFPDEPAIVAVKLAATRPAWAGRGVFTALLQHTEEAARARGCRLLRIDTSSAYSALAAERRGFERVSTLRYAELTWDGEPLVCPPPPHTHDHVYIKHLAPLTHLPPYISS